MTIDPKWICRGSFEPPIIMVVFYFLALSDDSWKRCSQKRCILVWNISWSIEKNQISQLSILKFRVVHLDFRFAQMNGRWPLLYNEEMLFNWISISRLIIYYKSAIIKMINFTLFQKDEWVIFSYRSFAHYTVNTTQSLLIKLWAFHCHSLLCIDILGLITHISFEKTNVHVQIHCLQTSDWIWRTFKLALAVQKMFWIEISLLRTHFLDDNGQNNQILLREKNVP